MYIRLNSSYNIVSLTDDFLTLKKYENDIFEFEVKYLFSQELGIKQNATNIKIEIANSIPPLTNTAPGLSNEKLVKSILTNRRTHSEAVTNYNKQSLLLSTKSDPTTVVSNEVVHLFNQGYSIDQIPQLRKTHLKVVDSSKTNIKSLNFQHDVGELNNDEIQLSEQLLLSGVDPSDSYTQNELGITIKEAYSGTNKKSPTVFESKEQKLLYQYKNNAFLKPIIQLGPGEIGEIINEQKDKSKLSISTSQEPITDVEVVKNVSFRYASAASDRLYLTIRVLDINNVTIQMVTREFSPKEYIKFNSIPVISPSVKTSGYKNKSHALLAIKQNDVKAKSVKIYKRTYDHNTLEVNSYQFINEVNLKYTDGWKYIPVQNSLGNTTIYRVVAIGDDGTVGSGFETIVLKPILKNSNIKRACVTTKPSLNGVVISVNHLPSDCVSIQLMREDITVNKKQIEKISTPIYLNSSDPNSEYTLEDKTVKKDHIYNYYCRLYRKNGSFFDKLVCMYEHYPLLENLVDTQLIDARVIESDLGYDAQFKIETKVVSTDVDKYKILLERQGMYDLFTDDIKNAREQLGKLIAHSVSRVDLTTGQIENFGTTTNLEFSDLELRKISGVSDPVPGRKYRYIVTALLRAPETMLENFIKTTKDSTTGRNYQYSPFKFLHPVVSKTGNLISNNSLKTNYSKDPMSFGYIGNYASIDIALDKNLSSVKNVVRENFGSNIDVLKWSIVGSSRDIDHFQIIKEYDGIKKIVGRFMSIPDVSNYQFVAKVDTLEVGLDVIYEILPVYHDFTRGNSVQASNAGKVS